MHVGEDLEECIGLVYLEFVATTAAVDRPRNSDLSTVRDSLGCMAEVVFLQLGIDTA